MKLNKEMKILLIEILKSGTINEKQAQIIETYFKDNNLSKNITIKFI